MYLSHIKYTLNYLFILSSISAKNMSVSTCTACRGFGRKSVDYLGSESSPVRYILYSSPNVSIYTTLTY